MQLFGHDDHKKSWNSSIGKVMNFNKWVKHHAKAYPVQYFSIHNMDVSIYITFSLFYYNLNLKKIKNGAIFLAYLFFDLFFWHVKWILEINIKVIKSESYFSINSNCCVSKEKSSVLNRNLKKEFLLKIFNFSNLCQ